MKNIIAFLSLALFIFSCSKKMNVPEPSRLISEMKIDVDKVTDSYDLSQDISSDVKIVSLETNDNCLIGNVFKIIYANQIYYILDKLSNQILLFDDKGKFVSKLNQSGSGPQEYVKIDEFVVVGEDIWIADNASKRIICYNKDYSAVESISMKDFWVYGMAYNAPYISMVNNWIPSGAKNHQVCIYNVNDKKKYYSKPFNPLDTDILHRGIKQQIAYAKNSSLFIISYNDTIFRMEGEKITPVYTYAFSKRFNNGQMKLNEKESPDNIKGIIGLYQTSKSVIILYPDQRQSRFAIYNKAEKQCRVYSDIRDVSLGNISIFPDYMDEEAIISIKEPSSLLYLNNEEHFLEKIDPNNPKKEQLSSIISNLKEESNPIIFHYKLKKDSKL